MVTVFFANIKLDLLYTTVSNRSREFSQNTHISKELFASYRINFKTGSEPIFNFKACDTRYLYFCQISNWSVCRSQYWSNQAILWYTLPAFLPNIKLEQLQVTDFKQSRGFSKANIICKVSFYSYLLNVFSKLFWMVHWFFFGQNL